MKELKGTKPKRTPDRICRRSQAARIWLLCLRREEGRLQQISAIFEETAGNEKGACQAVVQAAPCGKVPGTPDNLADAAGAKTMSGPTCTINSQRSARRRLRADRASV